MISALYFEYYKRPNNRLGYFWQDEYSILHDMTNLDLSLRIAHSKMVLEQKIKELLNFSLLSPKFIEHIISADMFRVRIQIDDGFEMHYLSIIGDIA